MLELEALTGALAPELVLTGEAAREKAAASLPRLGQPVAVVLPRTTEEVSAALKAAHAIGAPVVAWGGRTGLVEGGNAEGQIALSLERMNKVEAIDPFTGVMTVQAGCILQSACEAAEAAGFFLPLDLGARGSATIGGNISTNAGGNRVIRYGMMRDMVLGLEVVLADGTIVPAMNRLIKNNTGYDLKHLFIGAEGTLGIVTRAALRLRPKPLSQCTAYIAVEEFRALPALLKRLDRGLGGALSAFEVMWSDFYELVTSPPAKGRAPLPYGHAYYVLAEALGGEEDEDRERFERVLSGALEDGEAVDAAVAKSRAECQAMWGLRDDVAQLGRNAPVFTFDVSLPISAMEAYVAGIREGLAAVWPTTTLMVFGHLGDGNLHIIPGVGDGSPEAKHKVEEIVYRPLKAIGGSVSAEHGIGLQKREYLPLSRSAPELAMMRALKATLDPKGILNPGKILG